MRARGGSWEWTGLRALLLTCAFGLLCGCGVTEPPADFTFINGAEPESLDPAIVTGQLEGRLCNALFEGLLARDENGTLVPGMAERWEISPDARTYTFHLRDSRWSNGDPVTAHDFVYSWRRALLPATASRYAEQLYYLENGEALNRGQLTDPERLGVRAQDDRTLIVRLREPTPFFLELCAFTTLLPVHRPTIERWGDLWTKPGRMVSNGAYTLADWRIDYRIRLKANPHSWRAPTVRFKTIDALPISSATTAFNLFHAGQVQLVMDKGVIPTTLLPVLREKPYFHSAPFLATYFYRFNCNRKPFTDARVRMALALALDKKRIVERITQAGEPITGAFTPPGIPGYTPPRGLGYDPERARALLAEAGYPGGRGFPATSILYQTSLFEEKIAVEIQASWQQNLGIHVTLRNQEWKVAQQSLSRMDYDVARTSWVGDYNDPNTFLDCFVTDRGNNRTGWSNARYDALLAQAARTIDASRRFTLLREAETLLVEEALPLLPIFHYVGIALYNADRLGGFSQNLLDEHPLRCLFWKN